MSARTAKSVRTPKHRPPIGLQLIARALDGRDSGEHLREQLRRADARAARILTDPIANLEDEGPDAEIDGLARDFPEST